MVCLVCPKSCLLSVSCDQESFIVENNSCDRGLEFARKELTDPERMLTSTVQIAFGELPLVSVRSDRPVKKNELEILVERLNKMILTAPVQSGQIVMSALGENKVNIIATRTVDKAT